MRYAVDKIENNIIVLENLETGKKKEIEMKKEFGKISEGDIIGINIDGLVSVYNQEKIKREEELQNRFNKIKNRKR